MIFSGVSRIHAQQLWRNRFPPQWDRAMTSNQTKGQTDPGFRTLLCDKNCD